MKRFKVGDVVFISNAKFKAGDPWYTVTTGELMTVLTVDDDCYRLKWKRGGSTMRSAMRWSIENAHKGDLTLWTKSNWCRVFIGFMEMQK